jgi:DNA gyrase/topoisomerase IV subunit B
MPPAVLFETTMDPKKRQLLKVEVPSSQFLATEVTLSELMGKDPSSRAFWIAEAASDGLVDVDFEGGG